MSRDLDESSVFSDSEIDRHEEIARKEAIRAYYGEEALDGNSSTGDDETDIVDLLLAQPKEVASSIIKKRNDGEPRNDLEGLGKGELKSDCEKDDDSVDNSTRRSFQAETATLVRTQTRIESEVVDGWDHYEALSDDESEPKDTYQHLSSTTLGSKSEEELMMGKIGGRYSSEDDLETAEALSDWYEGEDPDVVNCYGVVHVKLLKGRKLPCPVRSNVLAVLRLLPWKGCVRLEKVLSSYASGSVVCDCSSQGFAPLVHAYSEGSSLPSLQIELFMITPLFLEFRMGTLTIRYERA